MGLRRWLGERAVRAAEVLVVETPGSFPVRVAVEREAVGRGWRLATSPASADVLVVTGDVGAFAEVVDRLWDAMPGPRARVSAATVDAAAAVLDDAARALQDGQAQTTDAAGRGTPEVGGGMDHGDMDMTPDGIPLAEGAGDDRDGLEMDALPVRLGPVLPYWPPGVVLDVTLHGDLVVAAHAVEWGPGPASPPPEDSALGAAHRCDEVAAALSLAGWEEGAGLARAARDQLLDHRGEDARALLVDLRHRVEHSRLLRWSLGGVGVVDPGRAEQLGLPDTVVGDCRDRLVVLVERAVTAAHDYAWTAAAGARAEDAQRVPLSAWGDLATGSDLAVARLVLGTLGSPAPTAEVGAGA